MFRSGKKLTLNISDFDEHELTFMYPDHSHLTTVYGADVPHLFYQPPEDWRDKPVWGRLFTFPELLAEYAPLGIGQSVQSHLDRGGWAGCYVEAHIWCRDKRTKKPEQGAYVTTSTLCQTMFPDLQDTSSFERFLAAPESILAMTPLWSTLPRPTIEKLSEISEDLGKEGITIFAFTEDDPAKNPLMAEWITHHDHRDVPLLPNIATGGGCLVACDSGRPIAIQPGTWQWSTEKLRAWIQSNRSKKTLHPTEGNAAV